MYHDGGCIVHKFIGNCLITLDPWQILIHKLHYSKDVISNSMINYVRHNDKQNELKSMICKIWDHPINEAFGFYENSQIQRVYFSDNFKAY